MQHLLCKSYSKVVATDPLSLPEPLSYNPICILMDYLEEAFNMGA